MIDNLKEPEESLPLSTPYLTFTGEVTGEHEVINIDDDNDKINTFKISRCLYNYFSRENEEKKKDIEISVVYNDSKRFKSVSEYVKKNFIFHVSGNLCIGEKLFLMEQSVL